MLQVRFRQPQIPRTAQVKGAHALRNSRFNTGPQGIGLLEGFGALPCCLESGMLLFLATFAWFTRPLLMYWSFSLLVGGNALG